MKGSARNLAACRLLIVDDSAVIRDLLHAYVGDMNQEFENETFEIVAEAANGQDAVDQAKKYNPDVIIMDVRMPVMDGVEATRCIKQELGLSAVVITATSFDCREIEEVAYQAGASFHVRKPLDYDEVKDAVSQALYQRSLVPVLGA